MVASVIYWNPLYAYIAVGVAVRFPVLSEAYPAVVIWFAAL